MAQIVLTSVSTNCVVFRRQIVISSHITLLEVFQDACSNNLIAAFMLMIRSDFWITLTSNYSPVLQDSLVFYSNKKLLTGLVILLCTEVLQQKHSVIYSS